MAKVNCDNNNNNNRKQKKSTTAHEFQTNMQDGERK